MKFHLAIAACAALMATQAQAHVEIGTYEGIAADGEKCEIEVLREWHENEIHHGLNHRVEIRANGLTIAVAHPPQVDAEVGTVRFDHDVLVGVMGVPKKGIAMVLSMDHTPGNDGPKALTVLVDDYVDAASSARVTCSGLKHVER